MKTIIHRYEKRLVSLDKKKLALTMILFWACALLNAQDYEWTIGIEGRAWNPPTAQMSADDQGNVYVAGSFEGTSVDFNPFGTPILEATQNLKANIYLAKYDDQGNNIWINNIGVDVSSSATGAAVPTAITTDASGNVYIAGVIHGPVDFDPGPGTAIIGANYQKWMFFAKYDSNGNYLLAVDFAWGLSPQGLAVDAAENIYVAGGFDGTGVDFDPGPGTAILNTAANQDIYMAKYDANGNYVWAQSIGGDSFDYCMDMEMDSNEDIIVSGMFSSTGMDFDPSANDSIIFLTSASSDTYLAKYTSNGDFLWAGTAGGSSAEAIKDIGIDTNDNIICTGWIFNTVDFDFGPGVANLTSNGSGDILLVKYDANGNYIWGHALAGVGNDQGNDVAIGPDNKIYITGKFQGTNVDLDPGPGADTINSQGGAGDVFVAKFDENGIFEWATSAGGSFEDIGISLWVDANYNVWVGGMFNSDSMDMNPDAGQVDYLYRSGTEDSFFFRYSQCVAPTFNNELTATTACHGSNATFNTNVSGGGSLSYQWQYNGVDIPGETNPTLSINNLVGSDSGYYSCIVFSNCGADTTGGFLTISQILLSATSMDEVLGNDGSIDLTALGGTQPYTFQWDNGAGTGEDPSGLAGGSYTVLVTDAMGCEDSITVLVGSQVGIQDFAPAWTAIAYPNPAHGILNIRVDGNHDQLTMNMLDATGRLVRHGSISVGQTLSFDTSPLSAGMYFVSLSDTNGHATTLTIALR